jgi:hypothetical protein
MGHEQSSYNGWMTASSFDSSIVMSNMLTLLVEGNMRPAGANVVPNEVFLSALARCKQHPNLWVNRGAFNALITTDNISVGDNKSGEFKPVFNPLEPSGFDVVSKQQPVGFRLANREPRAMLYAASQETDSIISHIILPGISVPDHGGYLLHRLASAHLLEHVEIVQHPHAPGSSYYNIGKWFRKLIPDLTALPTVDPYMDTWGDAMSLASKNKYTLRDLTIKDALQKARTLFCPAINSNENLRLAEFLIAIEGFRFNKDWISLPSGLDFNKAYKEALTGTENVIKDFSHRTLASMIPWLLQGPVFYYSMLDAYLKHVDAVMDRQSDTPGYTYYGKLREQIAQCAKLIPLHPLLQSIVNITTNTKVKSIIGDGPLVLVDQPRAKFVGDRAFIPGKLRSLMLLMKTYSLLKLHQMSGVAWGDVTSREVADEFVVNESKGFYTPLQSATEPPDFIMSPGMLLSSFAHLGHLRDHITYSISARGWNSSLSDWASGIEISQRGANFSLSDGHGMTTDGRAELLGFRPVLSMDNIEYESCSEIAGLDFLTVKSAYVDVQDLNDSSSLTYVLDSKKDQSQQSNAHDKSVVKRDNSAITDKILVRSGYPGSGGKVVSEWMSSNYCMDHYVYPIEGYATSPGITPELRSVIPYCCWMGQKAEKAFSYFAVSSTPILMYAIGIWRARLEKCTPNLWHEATPAMSMTMARSVDSFFNTAPKIAEVSRGLTRNAASVRFSTNKDESDLSYPTWPLVRVGVERETQDSTTTKSSSGRKYRNDWVSYLSTKITVDEALSFVPRKNVMGDLTLSDVYASSSILSTSWLLLDVPTTKVILRMALQPNYFLLDKNAQEHREVSQTGTVIYTDRTEEESQLNPGFNTLINSILGMTFVAPLVDLTQAETDSSLLMDEKKSANL